MRQDIEFDAEGTTLRGWLYVPDNAAGPAPTIVMCHGYSAVKELFLDAFAEVFCEAGFCALVYDNRNLGASDGEPRQEIDPWAQVHDYRHAITFARTLDEVDGERIGIWGSSYSGAHALVVGAIDRRVKCVVAQVPLISGHENARRLVRADLIKPTQDMFDADREARYRGEAPMMIPVVAPEGEPCALPTGDSYDWFTTSGSERAPSWINECTLRSVEMFWEYEPGTYLPFDLTHAAADGRRAGRSPDGVGPRDRRVRAGTRAEEARDPERRALRRLHRGLRALQRRRSRLVRPAPDGHDP